MPLRMGCPADLPWWEAWPGQRRGRFIQNFNIRYPVTAGAEALVKKMSAQAGKYGWILDWSRDNPPCVIDPESPVVKELTALCRQVLGTETKAYSMGGHLRQETA